MLNVDDSNNKKTPSELSPKLLNFWIYNNLKDCSKTNLKYVTTRSKPKIKTNTTNKTNKTNKNKIKLN